MVKNTFFLKKIAKRAQKSTEKDLIERQILNKELLKYHLPSNFLFVHLTCFQSQKKNRIINKRRQCSSFKRHKYFLS